VQTLSSLYTNERNECIFVHCKFFGKKKQYVHNLILQREQLNKETLVHVSSKLHVDTSNLLFGNKMFPHLKQ
jgi:hypothetical protein